MPTESVPQEPDIAETRDPEEQAGSGGVLRLENYFIPVADDPEQIRDTAQADAAEDVAEKLRSLKKSIKKCNERIDTLAEEAETFQLPEGEDPVAALLVRLAMKEKKKTFKLIYGIVKEYAGSDNADPARIPVLFRELFELCATGTVSKSE